MEFLDFKELIEQSSDVSGNLQAQQEEGVDLETINPLPRQTLVMLSPPSEEAGTNKGAVETITDNYGESAYGFHQGLSAMRKFALWLPLVPEGVTNFSAGIGDGITIGLTRHVRKWTGLSAEVDTATQTYTNGTLVGMVSLGGGVGNIATRNLIAALKAGKAGVQLAKMGQVYNATTSEG